MDPESIARENLLFPLAQRPGRLLLAMANPADKDTLEKLQFIFRCDIEAFLAPAEQILDAIERNYGQLEQDQVTEYFAVFEAVAIDPPPEADERAVPMLVNLLIREAVNLHAAEIRIEPHEDRLLVRYRIDGELAERDNPPRRLLAPIVARLRTMAGLDRAGDQGVQRGRIRMHVAGNLRNFDITMMPTDLGPRTVLTL